LKRRVGLRRRSLARSGLSREDRDELRDLARQVCFIRANCARVEVGNSVMWYGRCEHCRKSAYLQWSHVEPQGRCPHLRYDPDNYYALCWFCHFQWWHKGGSEVEAWIRQHIGDAARDRLALRARTRGHRVDYTATRMLLTMMIRDMTKGAK